MSRSTLLLCLLAVMAGFAAETDAHKGKCKHVKCKKASNPCRVAKCNPDSGKCYTVKRKNGAKCADKNKCTVNSKCYDGMCIGVAKVCKPPKADAACADRVCNLFTGKCILTPKNEGGVCDDGRNCTVGDKCLAGKCVGAPKVCNGTEFGPCKSVKCMEPTGECTPTNKTDGTHCGDGDRCTVINVCMAGTCTPGQPKNCTSTQCIKRSCNPLTGRCDAEYLDGVTCDDGRKCTTDDKCVNGVCRGTPVACNASTIPCKVNVCRESTGMCDKVRNAPDYTVCDDGNNCTFGDHCKTGKCIGRPKCPENDAKKCTYFTCDPTVGKCVSALRADGTRCADGRKATTNDKCMNGFCRGDL